MNRIALALTSVLTGAVLVAGCAAPAANVTQVQPGMSAEQVRALLGPPQAMAYSAGKQCSYYVMLKDFWSRVPWSVNDRYFVCYDDRKVESFGRVDAAATELSLANRQ